MIRFEGNEFTTTKIVLNSSQSDQSTEEKGMFDNIEYKHTARISADAKSIRLWAWMWETDPSTIDACKFFWGYVFAPANLLIRALIFPFWLIWQGLKAFARKIDDWIPEQTGTMRVADAQIQKLEEKAKEEKAAAKKQRREERIARFFGFVSTQVDRVVGVAKACWPVTRFVLMGLGAILAVIVAAGLIFLLYLLVDLIINNGDGILNVLKIAGIIIGLASVAVLIAFSILYFFWETRPGKAVISWIGRVFGGFGGAMLAGLIGIKTRTCPKIELIDAKTKTQVPKGSEAAL